LPCETAKLLLIESITANLLARGTCGLNQSLPRTHWVRGLGVGKNWSRM